MLKIDLDNRALEPTLTQTLIEAGIKERPDLQGLIERNSKVFFDEIGLGDAVFLGAEVKPANDMVGDRIDLLAYNNKDGTIIVIELKRGSNKLHLLQGISYAAMIAKWQPDQFRKLNQNRDLELDEGIKINSAQRIVLVADAFEYEVLITAEWLVETYDLDILCIRLKFARDPASGAEYLMCEQAYPPLEIEDQAIRRRAQKRGESPPPQDPAEILAATTNADVSAFFAEQRTKKVTFDEKNKALRYVVGSRVAWSVSMQKRDAAVWQYRRFSGDLEFWRQRLSKPKNVGERDDGHALRFKLENKSDFDKFLDALTKASTFEWQNKPRGQGGDGHFLPSS
jgi:hypothetical protein